MQIYMKPTRKERTDLLERMRAARSERGLSYAALGERADVDPSQVSRIRQTRNHRVRLWSKLAQMWPGHASSARFGELGIKLRQVQTD
jgi:ribosome-binding protein aMBF1 (putative translation factor)